MNEENKIRKACSVCGSEDVKMDAWVVWNYDKQEWEIDNLFGEDCWCENCEDNCKITDKED